MSCICLFHALDDLYIGFPPVDPKRDTTAADPKENTG